MTIMFKGEYHKIVILVLSCFGNEKTVIFLLSVKKIIVFNLLILLNTTGGGWIDQSFVQFN